MTPSPRCCPPWPSWASVSCRSARWARGSSPAPSRRPPPFADGDIRATIPRFEAENRAANQAIVDHVRALAAAKGATPGQIALAWLLAQHPWIVPIPGTRRIERVQENMTATQVGLSADEVADLNGLAIRVGVRGNRYDEAGMARVGL